MYENVHLYGSLVAQFGYIMQLGSLRNISELGNQTPVKVQVVPWWEARKRGEGRDRATHKPCRRSHEIAPSASLCETNLVRCTGRAHLQSVAQPLSDPAFLHQPAQHALGGAASPFTRWRR